jgi:hypothetical protein
MAKIRQDNKLPMETSKWGLDGNVIISVDVSVVMIKHNGIPIESICFKK